MIGIQICHSGKKDLMVLFPKMRPTFLIQRRSRANWNWSIAECTLESRWMWSTCRDCFARAGREKLGQSISQSQCTMYILLCTAFFLSTTPLSLVHILRCFFFTKRGSEFFSYFRGIVILCIINFKAKYKRRKIWKCSWLLTRNCRQNMKQFPYYQARANYALGGEISNWRCTELKYQIGG